MTREETTDVLNKIVEANPKKAERAPSEPLIREWFKAQTLRYSFNRAEEDVVAELVSERFGASE